jgi:aldose sugar dehydrogenase
MQHFFLIIFLLSASTSLAGRTLTSEGQQFQWEVLTRGRDVVWGFDFLPEGEVIFTERQGKVRLFNPATKKTLELTGLPAVHAVGQGGLMDVRLHPDFKENRWVYFTYSEAGQEGKATTALGRARLENQKLVDFKKIFTAQALTGRNIHFGSRLVFDRKGHLFLTIGDRGVPDEAQLLTSHNGSVLRLKEDGTVPADNPFVDKPGARPEIWSYGHRNSQGLYFGHTSGELWSVEFGPLGGDELHVIEKGKNYGWPVISYGREYSGKPVGEGKTHHPEMEQPLHYWVPAISPSGMTLYEADRFPGWKGNVFLAALGTTHLRRLVLEGRKVIREEELLREAGLRIRQVLVGPDGLLYLSTDEGHLGRLAPVK